jgi:predicted dehydrogenase
MKRQTSRREFLQASAVAGVGFWVGGSAAGEGKSANGKLNIAGIGVGGKGHSDIMQAANHGNVVAICDIDDNHLGKAYDDLVKKGQQPKKYNDFRKMFDEIAKDIDAVTVSTPDHTHAPASITAMKLKKHVYCQKPLTHDVAEARIMRELAAKMGVCTQMGNQGTAENALRRAAEIIPAGAIGPVREAHIWTNRPIWPQAPGVTKRPMEYPVPPHVHWEEFIGTAPMRPYAKYDSKDKHGAYHDFNWRGWWDFGTGALGDMGCHTANLPYMALKLGYPSTISAENGELNTETFPGWARVTYEFPARGDMPPVKVIWYEGKKDGRLVHPPEDLQAKVLKNGEKLPGSGSILVGDKGILYSPSDYGEKYKLLPEEAFKDYKGPAESLPRNGRGDDGMKIEWIEAIRQNKPAIAMSNFAYSGMLAEFILLGNVAIRAGQKLEWDGPHMRFTNNSGANQYLKREYRKGWEV